MILGIVASSISSTPVEILGTEMLDNPNFDDDSVWLTYGTWEISGGTANCVANTSTLRQQQTFPTAGVYRVTWDMISGFTGTLKIRIETAAYSFTGIESESVSLDVQAPAGLNWFDIVGDTSFTGSVDNFSCRQIMNYVLDTHTTAKAAWSLRKLKSSATYSVKVRRSSDDATTDVELTVDGTLTTSSTVSAGGDLGTWASTDDVFIHTWYDQTGNGYHKTSSSNSTQPTIMTAGVVELLNGKAVIYGKSTGTNDLHSTFTIANTGDSFVYTSVGVMGIEVSGQNTHYPSGIMPGTQQNDKRLIGISPETSGGLQIRSGGDYTDFSGAIAVDTQYIISTAHTATSSNFKGRQDGIALTTGTTAYTINMQADSAFTNFLVDSYDVGTTREDGYIQEEIWFLSDKWSDIPDIEDNMNDFYGTFSDYFPTENAASYLYIDAVGLSSSNSTITTDASNQYDERPKSIKIVGTGGTYATGYYDITGLTNGATYEFTCWCKVDTNSQQYIRIAASGGWVSTVDTQVDATTFTKYTFQGTTDATTGTIDFRARHDAGSATDTLWVGLVTMREV